MNRVPVRVVIGAAEAPAGWAALRSKVCPCCIGRVQMQLDLVRLIRDERPHGVLIELANADHLPALRRALAEWPLSGYVAL
jgi:hypothetical protein